MLFIFARQLYHKRPPQSPPAHRIDIRSRTPAPKRSLPPIRPYGLNGNSTSQVTGPSGYTYCPV